MANETYEISLSMHNQAGNFFQNVFAYDVNEAGGHSAFDYADDLITKWIAQNEISFLALLGDDVILDFYTARRVSGSKGPAATGISGNAGSAASASLTTGLCADVFWLNGSITNRGGHTFVGGPPAGSISGDLWQGGYSTKIATWVTNMLTALNIIGPSSATFSTFSRKLGSVSHITKGILRPKATMMNRRLKPQI
jgi:hypothetical protein